MTLSHIQDLILFLVFTSLVSFSQSTSAWDCDLTDKSIKTFDASDVGRCPEFNRSYGPQSATAVQVIQSHSTFKVPVLRCQVVVSTSVTRCGFNSLTYGQKWIFWEKNLLIDVHECREMLATKSYRGRDWVQPIMIGETNTFVRTIEGEVKSDGECSGASFTLAGTQYHKAYAQNTYKLKVTHEHGVVSTATNSIKLLNSYQASYSDGSARSEGAGLMIWDPTLPDCLSHYSSIFIGPAKMAKAINSSISKDLLVIQDDSRAKYGGFYLGKEEQICQYRFRATQAPGIFIRTGVDIAHPYVFKSDREETFSRSLELSSLVSLALISESVKSEQAFEDIHNYICETDRLSLMTLLLNARQSPDGGFLIQRGLTGVRIVPAGQVIHVVPCTSVTCGKASVDYCTMELPVLYNGTVRFMDPMTKILKRVGSRIPCDPLTPACWDVTGTWYCGYPDIRIAPEPLQLKPRDPAIQQESPFGAFNGHGWYSEEEKERFNEKALFEDTKPAVSNDFATASVLRQSPSEGLMNPIADSMSGHIAVVADGVAHPFTSWMGGAQRIFMIIVIVVPLLIATIAILIRCSILYKLRGCGCHMLGAFNETFMVIVMVPFRLLSSVTLTMTGIFKTALRKHEDDHAVDPETGVLMKIKGKIEEDAQDDLVESVRARLS